MNILSPSFYLILLGFMIFPLIAGGKLNESGAKIIASFMVTVFCSPVLIAFYIVAIYFLV